jgi:hypothetical protein
MGCLDGLARLVTGILLLILAAGLTSCSHLLSYHPVKVNEAVNYQTN